MSGSFAFTPDAGPPAAGVRVADEGRVGDDAGAGAVFRGEVGEWLRRLIQTPVAGLSRAELIDQIAALERLTNAAAARQARLAVALEAAERQSQAAAGVPRSRQGQGVAAQIGLARRQSPVRAALFLSRAKTLCLDLPATMTTFVAGELSEYRAGLVATEVALLDPADRARADTELCGIAAHAQAVTDPLAAIQTGAAAANPLAGMSDRQIRAAAAATAYRIDPTTPLRRGRHAETERYVSLRPAPDTMAILSAYLPVRSGVACLASLHAAADTARATGDPRTRGQVMADTLTARLTGREHAADIPLELQLILTDHDLVADLLTPTAPKAHADHSTHHGAAHTDHPEADADDHPEADADAEDAGHATHGAGVDNTSQATDAHHAAVEDHAGRTGHSTVYLATAPDGATDAFDADHAHNEAYAADTGAAFLAGYGPLSAATARSWLRDNLDADAKVWIRRLITDPITGQATALDTRSRLFPPALRRLILARDRYCRTPYCGAPIRHLDHARPHAQGGATDVTNGQGLCERCNHAKTAPGWTAHAIPDPTNTNRHLIHTTTPTGHTYTSTAPAIRRPDDEAMASRAGATGNRGSRGKSTDAPPIPHLPHTG